MNEVRGGELERATYGSAGSLELHKKDTHDASIPNWCPTLTNHASCRPANLVPDGRGLDVESASERVYLIRFSDSSRFSAARSRLLPLPSTYLATHPSEPPDSSPYPSLFSLSFRACPHHTKMGTLRRRRRRWPSTHSPAASPSSRWRPTPILTRASTTLPRSRSTSTGSRIGSCRYVFVSIHLDGRSRTKRGGGPSDVELTLFPPLARRVCVRRLRTLRGSCVRVYLRAPRLPRSPRSVCRSV